MLAPSSDFVVYDRGGYVNGFIYRVAATGGTPRRLTSGEEAAWSPDGSKIAFVRGFSIYLMDADGTNVEQLAAGSEAEALSAPAWSPNSKQIAFSLERIRVRNAGKPSIEVVDRDGANRRTTPTGEDGEFAPAFAWSPDGRSFSFRQ